MINQLNRKNHKKRTVFYRNSSSEVDEEITGWKEYSERLDKHAQLTHNINKFKVNFGSLNVKTVGSPEVKQEVQSYRKTQADFFHKKPHRCNEKFSKIVNTSGIERDTFIKRKSIAELENLFKTLEPNLIKNSTVALSNIPPCTHTPNPPEKIGVPIFSFFPRIDISKFIHEKHKF